MDGRCPDHPTLELQWLEEENYFFRLSRYQGALEQLYRENPSFCEPEHFRNEVLGWLRDGLTDFSVSRAGSSWGIPFPGDEAHRIYVWFDALTNYVTGAGFPGDPDSFARFWPADLHVIGKNMTRLHCPYWPATQMRAGLGRPVPACAHGADVLWRIQHNARLPREQPLADGAYLSRIYRSKKDRRQQRNGVLVRVIEYRLHGVTDAEPIYRLMTSLLDPAQAPAAELAALYHERWEIETALAELKTHLRGAKIVLRSKTPDLVRQEFYGLMMAHFAIRGLMHEAALKADVDPDQLSFLHAVRVVRRKLAAFHAIPPSAAQNVSRAHPGRNPRRARRVQSRSAPSTRGQAQNEQLPSATLACDPSSTDRPQTSHYHH